MQVLKTQQCGGSQSELVAKFQGETTQMQPSLQNAALLAEVHHFPFIFPKILAEMVAPAFPFA